MAEKDRGDIEINLCEPFFNTSTHLMLSINMHVSESTKPTQTPSVQPHFLQKRHSEN